MGLYENTKRAVVISTASTTNGATATGYVDTLGYDHLSIDVNMTSSDSATNEPIVLSIRESDTVTSYTSMSAIVALTGGTATSTSVGFVIPATVYTNANNVFSFEIDLRGRKRYVGVAVTPPTTQIITAIARLGAGDKAPTSTTDAGCLLLQSA